ncbi:hypothetical protein METY_3353 [Methylopila sp. Yamaguchi]|nr:hypothetical protein METY_3353 [Methylopila sp. Yamaguchi]
MAPSQERFRANQIAGFKINLGLVVEYELLIGDGGLEFVREPNAVPRVPFILGREGKGRMVRFDLRSVERGARLPDEVERVRTGGADSEADCEPNRQRGAGQQKARSQQVYDAGDEI